MEHILKISANLKSINDPHHTTVLSKGSWSVCSIHDEELNFIAWNAWSGQVTGCSTPSSCTRGWLNSYKIWSPDFVSIPRNTISVGSGRYSSPELAVQSATPATFLIGAENAIVTFFIHDSYHDNVGGLTLELKKNTA